MTHVSRPPARQHTDAAETSIVSIETLRHVVETHKSGISEHELFKILAGIEAIPQFNADTDSITLFRAHFLLFHQLYRLRDQLLESQHAILMISPLKIQLIAYAPGHPAISEYDPLYRFYINLDNLRSLGKQELDHMLGKFWARLAGGDERKRALAELGLADPVDDDTILKTYRQLAMTLHPDRGGEKAAFQAISEAMLHLRKG
ncbi:MAG: DnaJ domain-containing protein [Gammaproteobacteria bacterium]|nr:DnaJ domain-containing protein [Gammaproteobacteria bacterium]